MKKYLLLMGICLVCGVVTAQNRIVGKVVGEDLKPMEFVNVVLLSLPDSTFIAGTMSAPDGSFSFAAEGDLVKLSSIGYTTEVRRTRDLQQPVILKEEASHLQEVVIKARLPKFKQTGDGIKTHVGGTSLAMVGSATDVLRNMPLLKEEENGFSVFGKGTPLIYINGRVLRDLTELERIKSEDIKDVEIITEPGARYDASVGCVIKIKTKAPQGEGWGFAVYSDYYQADREDLTGQLNVNYRKKRWDLLGTWKFSHDNYWRKSQVGQTVFVDTLWNQTNTMYSEGLNQQMQASLGVNFQLNDSNQLGTRLQMHAYWDTDEKTQVESLVQADHLFYDRWKNQEDKTISNAPLYDYNAYYQGKIGNWSLDFNFDMLFSGSDVYARVEEYSEMNDDRLVQSENQVDNKLFATRLVAGHPCLGGDLFAGVEHSFINRKDHYINYQEIVPSSYSRLKENYLSSFVEYKRKFRLGVLKAGLRYEFVDFDYFDKGIYKPEQSRRYNQFFPQFSWGTQLGKVSLQAAYTSKVKRPSFSQLSNNVFYGNRYTLQTGNPLLKSAIENNWAISGLWKMVQFGLSFSREKDAIIYAAEQLEDNPAVTKVLFRNLDKLDVLNSFVSVAPEWGIWSPQLTVGLRKQWLSVVSNQETVRMNKPLWNTSFANFFRLPGGLLLALNFSFQSKGDYQNVYLNTTQYMLNASITKTFCDNRLTVQLKGYDLLDGYRDGNLLYNQQMQMDILNRTDRRKVGISVKYKFNLDSSKYRKNQLNADRKKRL